MFIAQPCRHIKSEAFPTLKGLCDIYVYGIKFSMLDVPENEKALLKLSGGTAQLRSLEGTLDELIRPAKIITLPIFFLCR